MNNQDISSKQNESWLRYKFEDQEVIGYSLYLTESDLWRISSCAKIQNKSRRLIIIDY